MGFKAVPLINSNTFSELHRQHGSAEQRSAHDTHGSCVKNNTAKFVQLDVREVSRLANVVKGINRECMKQDGGCAALWELARVNDVTN